EDFLGAEVEIDVIEREPKQEDFGRTEEKIKEPKEVVEDKARMKISEKDEEIISGVGEIVPENVEIESSTEVPIDIKKDMPKALDDKHKRKEEGEEKRKKSLEDKKLAEQKANEEAEAARKKALEEEKEVDTGVKKFVLEDEKPKDVKGDLPTQFEKLEKTKLEEIPAKQPKEEEAKTPETKKEP
uniref:Uncharacterized protein n=1 Tax=Meloidogyne javanica TaxID=6303 RepID=A0A915MBX9_MELJA